MGWWNELVERTQKLYGQITDTEGEKLYVVSQMVQLVTAIFPLPAAPNGLIVENLNPLDIATGAGPAGPVQNDTHNPAAVDFAAEAAPLVNDPPAALGGIMDEWDPMPQVDDAFLPQAIDRPSHYPSSGS